MSETSLNESIFENDRTIEGFDIYFWIFNDASSFVATHWHTAIEMMYIMEGEVDVSINNQTTALLPGDVYLIDSKVPHSTQSLNGNHAVLMQLPYPFLKKYIPDIDSYQFSFDCHSDNPIMQSKLAQLREVIEQMCIVYENNSKGGLLRFNSLLFEMLYLLLNNFSRKIEIPQLKKDIKNYMRLEPVLSYSNEHYNEPITLSEISDIACFQTEYFCHYFKKNMGMTYFKYLNEIRLSHICQDLIATDYSLKQLLEIHGFTNYKLFRRMFSEKFHMTPGEYRKTHASQE